MSIHYNKMPIYTVKYNCSICDYSVGDLTIHQRSKRHKKFEDLYKLLNQTKDETRKEKIIELIDYEKKRREQSSLKYETTYKQYFKELYKKKKENDKPPPTIVLKSRKEIKRNDGTIEYQEIWYDKEDRWNNLKSK